MLRKHSPCHFIHHNDTIACCIKQTTETRQQASENDSDQTTSSITKGWSLAHAKNLSQRITSAVSSLDIPGSLQSSDRLSQNRNAATCSRSGKLLGLDIECRQRLIRFQHPERSPDVRLHACHVQSSSSACRTDRREHHVSCFVAGQRFMSGGRAGDVGEVERRSAADRHRGWREGGRKEDGWFLMRGSEVKRHIGKREAQWEAGEREA
jgi:hypothetical protein